MKKVKLRKRLLFYPGLLVAGLAGMTIAGSAGAEPLLGLALVLGTSLIAGSEDVNSIAEIDELKARVRELESNLPSS